jgi:hypothetical protein
MENLVTFILSNFTAQQVVGSTLHNLHYQNNFNDLIHNI